MMTRSLSRRLTVYFLTVILLTLLTVSIAVYLRSTAELDKQNEQYMSQIVDNALEQTDSYLQAYERLTLSFMADERVKEFLDLKADDDYEAYAYRASIKESGIAPIFIRNPEVIMVYLIGSNGRAAYDYNSAISRPIDEEFLVGRARELEPLINDKGKMSVLNTGFSGIKDTFVVTMARRISGRKTPEFKGILGMEIKSQELARLWRRIHLGERSYFYIVDADGEFVYHPDASRIGSKLEPVLWEHIGRKTGERFISPSDGEDRMFISRKSDYSGWHLVLSVPVEELRKPVSGIRWTTAWVGLITLLIAVVLAFRFGSTITRPIRELVGGMRETEKGNWTTLPLPKTGDEVEGLVASYNLMVGRLSELVSQVYEAELANQKIRMERQTAEFQALQLQINPHFLYNTLETIVAYAVIQQSEEIKEIVRSMAYMLRYSVQTDLEEITVASELKHVLNYMAIINHRTGRHFEVEVAIPSEYLLHHMVRLTLQPLVENAFLHAFPDGIEDRHRIRIDGRMTDDFFEIMVEDNGEGIPPDKLAELSELLRTSRLTDLHAGKGDRKGGIGLVNVHRRIQMVFGESCGILLQSVPGHGTAAIMRIPKGPARGSSKKIS
ncbi:cache domain-containing sensor histidine kinase [Paenibacillus hamazuiensis]|uniref:cache domain-containing sensor histidine kinase n=1 Tax=Paenibacillus hamazuiensis TaxID=2936508 RepID=UPI00200C43EF|nr:sensor histidine kinase [Paenibacillus hamazuiensis]